MDRERNIHAHYVILYDVIVYQHVLCIATHAVYICSGLVVQVRLKKTELSLKKLVAKQDSKSMDVHCVSM